MVGRLAGCHEVIKLRSKKGIVVITETWGSLATPEIIQKFENTF